MSSFEGYEIGVFDPDPFQAYRPAILDMRGVAQKGYAENLYGSSDRTIEEVSYQEGKNDADYS